MKNTTKIILGVLVIALVALGLYLDSRPIGDNMMDMEHDGAMNMENKTTGGTMKTNTGVTPEESVTTTISKDGKKVTKTVVATTPAKNPFPNTQWVWKYTIFADKSKRITPTTDRFVLKFGADGRMSSATDCNSVSGTYVTKINEGITFGPLMSTLMACTGDTLESEYSKELADVRLYSLPTQAELNLQLANNTGTMVFTKKTN